MKKYILILSIVLTAKVFAQPLSQQMAATVMTNWKDSFSLGNGPARWSYDMGVILKGFQGIWENTADKKYYNYIQQQMDFFVQDNGSIKNYKPDEYNIDHINNGKLILLLYKITQKEKYLKAAKLLYSQLETHPRTKEGSFWHKKIYPNQVWLDGLYMGQPFYAEYAQLTNNAAAFDDIANQFINIEIHTRDAATGLLYHAWDESKSIAWANKETGNAPNFWARAMGWYANAIVDVLDYFPTDHPKRKKLIQILARLTNALEKERDATTGLWYDVMHYDGIGKEKNYFETSAASQFIYAIAKGVRKKYLPTNKIDIATKAYKSLVEKFINVKNGQTNLEGTVKVSGLGGKPFRDGSFAYYMSEPIITNDPKGVGAFILASNEIEMLATLNIGKNKTVLLDQYYNSEKRKDINGNLQYWHYVWNEKSNSGFSLLGYIFEKYGANTKSLNDAPTKKKLKKSSVYIVVDPDHLRDNPMPNFVNDKHIKAIKKWVKAGGNLFLMANDSNNCELKNFNKLANEFGVTFTNKSINMVKNDAFEQGLIVPNDNDFFKQNYKMYLKEISTLEVNVPATTLVKKGDDIIMATASYGKGKVFVVGDPWLYNEYVDGRKLTPDFRNYNAAEDLVKWLLQ